jgi:DNA-binding protein HU-beta
MKNLKKSDLISAAAAKAGMEVKVIEKASESFFDALSEKLKEGNRVAIPGFGVFVLRSKKETKATNMRTGIPMVVPAHSFVAFRPSQKLKDSVRNAKV